MKSVGKYGKVQLYLAVLSSDSGSVPALPEERESGENPERTGHCNQVAGLMPLRKREGSRRETVSQETCLIREMVYGHHLKPIDDCDSALGEEASGNKHHLMAYLKVSMHVFGAH